MERVQRRKSGRGVVARMKDRQGEESRGRKMDGKTER